MGYQNYSKIHLLDPNQSKMLQFENIIISDRNARNIFR